MPPHPANLVEILFHRDGQTSLDLLTSNDKPLLASQRAGIIGVSHPARPHMNTCYMCRMCNDQVRVRGVFITLSIYFILFYFLRRSVAVFQAGVQWCNLGLL